MPRIPVYRNDARENPLPSVNLQSSGGFSTPEAFGSSQARLRGLQAGTIQTVAGGVTNLGLAMAREAKKEQDKYDNAFARQKEMELLDSSREHYTGLTEHYKLGDAKDPGDGLSVYDRQDIFFQDMYKSQTKKMTKNQRELYQPAFDRARQVYLGKADSYVTRQVDIYEKSQKQSQITYRENEAIDSRDNEEYLAELQVENELDIRSLYQGAPEEFIQEKIKNSNDRIHNNIVASYLRDEETVKAWRYFKENEADMSPKIKADTKTALEKASLKAHAENYADMIELEFDYQSGLEEAKNIKNKHVNNEELQTEVTRILKSRETERKQIQKASSDAKYNSALDIIRDAQGDTPEEKERISREYIDANFRGKERDSLINKASSIHKTGKIDTNIDEWEKLVTMSNEDKDKFINVNLNKYQLSDADHKRFFNLQMSLKEDKNPKVALSSQISQSGKVIGLFPDKKDPLLTQRFIDYKNKIIERVTEKETAEDRNLTIREVEEIINEEQIDVVTKGIEEGEVIGGGFLGLIDPDKTYEESVKRGEENLWIPDINTEQESYFKVLVEKDGVYEPNDFILRLYARRELGYGISPELNQKAQDYLR